MARSALSLTMSLVLLITGCGGNNDALHPSDMKLVPVNGRVMVGKQPLANATVKFKPKFEWKAEDPTPHATTAADGTFELETFLSSDGAPAGEYLVSIVIPSADGEAGGSNPGPYSDPEKSGLKATVKTSATKLPDFVIKGVPVRSTTGNRNSRR